MREVVTSRLDAKQKRTWHGRLALALEASGRADLGALAGHWYEAGARARAAEYAERAGDRAAESLAFGRAADLYRVALGIAARAREDERALRIKLADALGAAGLGADAAEAYLAATHGADADETIELERRAAHHLLRSGHVDAGLTGLRSVLGQLAMEVPADVRSAVRATLGRRRVLQARGLAFVERGAKDIPLRRILEVDTCWSAAVGLGLVDPVRGAFFSAQGVLLALEAGDAYRIVRALCLAAAFSSTPGDGGPMRMIEAADALAARTGHPHSIGLVRATRGTALFDEGRHCEALVHFDDAEVTFREECAGVSWERATVIVLALWCLWLAGDLAELARRAPLYLREADERGDRYFAAGLRSGALNVYWLLVDDPARARKENLAALASWSTDGFYLQHFQCLVADANIDLYEGDGRAAHRKVGEHWRSLLASRMLSLRFVRVPALHLRARAALGALETEVDAAGCAHLLRIATRMAMCLERESSRGAQGLAMLVQAALANYHGDREASRNLLERAGGIFDAARLVVFGQVARRRAAELFGDADAVASADRRMCEMGVSTPSRLAAMLAPGLLAVQR